MGKRLIICALSAFLAGCSLIDIFNPPDLIEDNTQEQTEVVDGGEEPYETLVERKDLLVALNFNYPEARNVYVVGGNFNFSGTVQNAGAEFITVDNRSISALEYRLLRGEEEVLRETIDDSFLIILREQGFLRAEYKDDRLTLTVGNADVEFDGDYFQIIPPVFKEFSQSFDVDSYVFKNPGRHRVELNVFYSLNEEEYRSTFSSEEFEVEEVL